MNASELVGAMNSDVEAWLDGAEVDVPTKYSRAIQETGIVPFLIEVFTVKEDATLSQWTSCFAPAWKNVAFGDWREILYALSPSRTAMYQFIPFATEYLGIDIVSVIQSDPRVDEAARHVARIDYPRGGPSPGSPWVREQMADRGVDLAEMWKRLAAEGAPMKSVRVPTPFKR